jgi:hypothetical protein
LTFPPPNAEALGHGGAAGAGFPARESALEVARDEGAEVVHGREGRASRAATPGGRSRNAWSSYARGIAQLSSALRCDQSADLSKRCAAPPSGEEGGALFIGKALRCARVQISSHAKTATCANGRARHVCGA